MNNQYHILNGDALKQQFPNEINGKQIVARECLVDGDVKGESLEELFQNRAQFLSTAYGDGSIEEYYQKTVTEFEKIQAIPENAVINLWFEDDLFCQVNCWFVVHLIGQSDKNYTLYLVRPEQHNQYGFGGYAESELPGLYENRLLLSAGEVDKIASLWKFYQEEDLENLTAVAQTLENKYPFILRAVEAHIDRIPANGNMGRPVQSLMEIMERLDTDNFGPVFAEFNKRESIYGFGDLQVKRLYDAIKNRA